MNKKTQSDIPFKFQKITTIRILNVSEVDALRREVKITESCVHSSSRCSVPEGFLYQLILYLCNQQNN